MAEYTWDVYVRITGCRDGWESTIVDAPTFTFESDAQFGSIYASEEHVRSAVEGMFRPLMQPGDELHITTTSR